MDHDWRVRKKLERGIGNKRDKPCCRNPDNLRYALALNNRKDSVALRCKVCGSVQYRLYAEPGRFGMGAQK